MPNVFGGFLSCPNFAYSTGSQSGAFKDAGQNSSVFTNTERVNFARKTNFDASLSNPLYGKANGVQVASAQFLIIIKA